LIQEVTLPDFRETINKAETASVPGTLGTDVLFRACR